MVPSSSMQWLVRGIVVALYCWPGPCLSDPLPPSLKTKQIYTQHERYTLVFSVGDRIVLDRGRGIAEIVRNDAVAESLNVKSTARVDRSTLLKDSQAREDLYSHQLVIASMGNAISDGKIIAVPHRLQNDRGFIRLVQFLDRDLSVLGMFEDEVPGSADTYRLGTEPFALGPSGQVAALGERGEILIYDSMGVVLTRVLVEGFFDNARNPAIELDEKRNYHLSEDTRELVRRDNDRRASKTKTLMIARDASLRDSTMKVPGFDYDNINGLCFMPDGSLNVLVGSESIVRIDPLARDSRTHQIAELVRSEMNADDGDIYQMICKGRNIYALTRFRVLHLLQADAIKKVGQIAISKEEDTVNQWNVLDPPLKGDDGFVFVDITHKGKRVVK